MPDRFERYLRWVCIALGAFFVYQVFQFATAPDPFGPPEMLVADAASADEGGDGARPDVPPVVSERIERITQSEILGPVPRPPPMALLGIGGADILLRTPNGQTGLLREGEELGGVKLIRIGINRVLIEHEGELKELTMFSGLGGESLIQK